MVLLWLGVGAVPVARTRRILRSFVLKDVMVGVRLLLNNVCRLELLLCHRVCPEWVYIEILLSSNCRASGFLFSVCIVV